MKPGGVRKQRFYAVPRDPERLVVSRVKTRSTQVNMLDAARMHRVRKRKEVQRGVTLQVCFTITMDLDRMIHDRALSANISRSAVVRQALLHYFGEM